MRRKLRILLAEQDLTLAHISRAEGIPYDRLTKIAAGYRQPRLEEIKRIARALKVSPEVLLPDVESRSGS